MNATPSESTPNVVIHSAVRGVEFRRPSGRGLLPWLLGRTARRLLVLAIALPVVAAASPACRGAIRVEAYAGQPLGVGRITLDIGPGQPSAPTADERFFVQSTDGHVLYPVVQQRPARRLLRRLLEIETPLSASIYFVFQGAEPFELQTFSPNERRVTVVPVVSPRQHQQLLRDWWSEYGKRWQQLRDDPAFPPFVENYLVASLARRLDLEIPEPSGGLLKLLTKSKTVWDDLLLNETAQLDLDQQMLSAAEESAPLQALPPPMPWYATGLADTQADADESHQQEIEPIAARVPVESFYVRFGNFTNYLWFRDLSKKWQGDLQNMIARRAIQRGGPLRIEQQLAIRETALSKLLGPQVIDDVALIGLDPWLDDGAAIGMLFHAKNSFLLDQTLVTQRREALQKFSDAAESVETIAGREVSLIATADNQVRSYYLQDEGFHLVTTSRQLMLRFIQTGRGERPLADSPSFQAVRAQLPDLQGATVFAYVPPEFVQQAASPEAWIEARRRVRSKREIQLIRLARWQAQAEGLDARSVEQLIAAGILPTGFGVRADQSELLEDDAGFRDSVRGAPGFFVPVSDAAVERVSADEAKAYRAFADAFRQEVGQTPPLAVSLTRQPVEGDGEGAGETMIVEIRAAPLDDVKLGRLPAILGEPTTDRVAPVDGDLIHGDIVVDAPLMAIGSDVELHHLFAGVRNFRLPLTTRGGKMAMEPGTRQLIRMYWGSWPKPGLLRWLINGPIVEGKPEAPGPQATWQAQRDDFLVMSFKPTVVDEVLPEIHVVQAERPGQLWFQVADVSQTQLAAAVNALGYARARETSVAASRLMNTLANQLHVPRVECRDAAEQIMGGEFVCPLGGEYALYEPVDGAPVWTSTALSPQDRFLLVEPPEDFQLPLLTWFRGLRLDARLDDDALSGRIEIDMAASAVP